MHYARRVCTIALAVLFAGACTSAKAERVSVGKPTPATSATTTTTTIDLASVEHYVVVSAINYAAADHARRVAFLRAVGEREARARAQLHASQTNELAGPGVMGTGACGGDLPSCGVLHRESRGNITAQNPVSSASGKWQMLDDTWGGYGGYAHAKDAPEHVQDERARQLPHCHWEPPNYCGG